MMSTEEVDILLPDDARLSDALKSTSTNDVVSNYIDNCADFTRFWIICICLALGNSADAIEITCVGYILTDIEHISAIEQEFLTSAVFIGMLFGGILCGYFSDIVGRKPVLLLSLGVNSLAGILSAFAPSVTALIVIRMIGGLGKSIFLSIKIIRIMSMYNSLSKVLVDPCLLYSLLLRKYSRQRYEEE